MLHLNNVRDAPYLATVARHPYFIYKPIYQQQEKIRAAFATELLVLPLLNR